MDYPQSAGEFNRKYNRPSLTEDEFTKSIEDYTASIPSSAFLGVAVAAMALSFVLQAGGQVRRRGSHDISLAVDHGVAEDCMQALGVIGPGGVETDDATDERQSGRRGGRHGTTLARGPRPSEVSGLGDWRRPVARGGRTDQAGPGPNG